MTRAHICNAFFELELEKKGSHSLRNLLYTHPPFLQLQFLPLLYAKPDEIILVTDLPDDPDPRLHLLDAPPPDIHEIEHWGPSQAIATWAKQHKIPYPSHNPDWIRTLNGKPFSFLESPKLPYAELLHTEAEAHRWIEKTPGPKVLKTALGTAGRGHFHVDRSPHLEPFVRKNLPLIGEPWVERILDFSTQWKNGTLLGTTLFENDLHGTYRGTKLTPIPTPFLEEHLAIAHPLVQKIKEMGYSDNLGIDAFVYLWNGETKVQPIVEINGRKTMSWVALQTQRNIQYIHSPEKGLLPSHLNNITFNRNLHIETTSEIGFCPRRTSAAFDSTCSAKLIQV